MHSAGLLSSCLSVHCINAKACWSSGGLTHISDGEVQNKARVPDPSAEVVQQVRGVAGH